MPRAKRHSSFAFYRGAALLFCVGLAFVLLLQGNAGYASPTQEAEQSASSQTSASLSATPTPLPTPSPTPVPNLYGDLLLKPGDEGDGVISLQLRLQDLGYYNYKITGSFGSVTKQAVMDFQEDNKLAQDGIVGGQTASLLYAMAPPALCTTAASPRPRRPPSPSPPQSLITPFPSTASSSNGARPTNWPPAAPPSR